MISRNSLRFFSTTVNSPFAISSKTIAGVAFGFESPRYFEAPIMHLSGSYDLVIQNDGGYVVHGFLLSGSSSFLTFSFENEKSENW